MSSTCRVPELRFGEFSGEWEEKKLWEVSKNIMYGMNSSAIKYDGKYKYIRITDIDELSRKFLPNPLTSPDGKIEEKFKLKENDILFTRTGASVGKSYIYKQNDGNLYFAGFLIKFNIDKANSKFVFLYTLKDIYTQWVSVMSVRSGQPGINAEEYKLLKIYLPLKQEQEKIASFLSSVDTKIEQLTSKIKLLQEYKKGVMQKIFSQEIRFHPKGISSQAHGKDVDGSNYPAWVEKKLGEQCSNISSGKTKVVNNGKFNIFGSTGIIGSTNDYTHSGDYILVARVGANAGLINFVNGKFAVTDNTLIIDVYKNKIVPKFLMPLLYKYNLNRLVFGSGQPLITGGQLKALIINLPSLKEQTKIASFLSSIDSKLLHVEKQLHSTKEFKKALLQKMFV